MSQAHLHLLINHLPIMGSMLGALVLIYGLYKKSEDTQAAAYGVFIIASLGTAVAYFTGEPAEEAVENLPGIVKATIEQHEDFAMLGLLSLILLGLLACIGLYFIYKKSSKTFRFAKVVLLICVIAFGMVSWTAYLGGKIRHTEFSSTQEKILLQTERESDKD